MVCTVWICTFLCLYFRRINEPLIISLCSIETDEMELKQEIIEPDPLQVEDESQILR